jgi:hypothetical protein
MFNEESQYLELDSAPRVRECMERGLETAKDVCARIVSFVQDLGQKLTQPALARLSPLMLNCIYSCAASLSWMSLETNNAQYIAGKLICADMLRSMSARWKLAGKAVPLTL